MLSISVIIGSLRKESINRTIFNHYHEIAKSAISFKEIEIKDFPLYNADISPAPEEVVKASKIIEESDGILFFTPEYNYSVPGLLKNAIDWLSRQEPQPFSGKKAAIIGASPGQVGTARIQYHLRQIGVFLNLEFLNRPEVMVGNSFSKVKEGKIEDQGTIEFLQKHFQAYVKFIKS